MREKVRDRGRLEHILEAIESIEEFHAQYTFEDIKKNKLIFYGFTKLASDRTDAPCPCAWLLYNRSRKPLGHDRSRHS